MEALSGQDRAFLIWESRARPMHFGAVCSFRLDPGQPLPSLDEVRHALAEAVAGEARLRQRLARRGWTRRPVWIDAEDFRIEDHVCELAGDSLPEAADRFLAPRLDRSRPLWEIGLVRAQPDPASFSLVVKIHHALSDGIGAVRLLERLLGGGRPRRDGKRAVLRPARPERAAAARGRGGVLALLRLLVGFLRGTPVTPLNGRVGTERRHRWFASDAATLDAAAVRFGATRNDLVLAVGAGGLRRELARAGPLPERLRAFCPVSLRAGGARHEGLGNRISLWLVDLPIAERDELARVAAIAGATAQRKRRRDAAGGAGVARLAERLGAWVSWLGMALAAWRRAYNVVITNVPGPSRPLRLLGATLEGIYPFAPLFPGQRVAFAMVRYDGRLHWGVSDGRAEPAAADRLAGSLRMALRKLARAAGVDALAPFAAESAPRCGPAPAVPAAGGAAGTAPPREGIAR